MIIVQPFWCCIKSKCLCYRLHRD